MAFVDFSNAQLHLPSDSTFNITTEAYASLYNSYLFNSSSQTIVNNNYCNLLKNEQKKLVFVYTGTFTESGTEFYFGHRSALYQKYKITGVSFQAGDTYSFQIPVTLTCL